MKNLRTIYPAAGTSALHPQEACNVATKGIIIEFPQRIEQHAPRPSSNRGFESIEGIPFGIFTRIQVVATFSIAVALSFIVAAL